MSLTSSKRRRLRRKHLEAFKYGKVYIPTIEQCAKHVCYVYNKAKGHRLIQDDPEMYFRKRFIVRAVRNYDGPVPSRPVVTKEQCVNHCKMMISRRTCENYSIEEIQDLTRGMIYRKSIIRLAVASNLKECV